MTLPPIVAGLFGALVLIGLTDAFERPALRGMIIGAILATGLFLTLPAGRHAITSAIAQVIG